MIEPGLINGRDRFFVGAVAQIEPADFRPDMFGQWDHVEARFGQNTHCSPVGSEISMP
jgi:hypothetical protein